MKDHPTISSDICLIKKKIAEQIVYLNNYKQMSFTILSHQDIDAAKLPNLLQLVDILKRKSSEIIAKRDANDHIDSNMEESWHSINMEYYNHADENKFIVVQTQNRRHTLKPNLRNCGFIYRGQRKEYPHILSSFARDEYDSQGNPLVLKQFRPKHLRSNIS